MKDNIVQLEIFFKEGIGIQKNVMDYDKIYYER